MKLLNTARKKKIAFIHRGSFSHSNSRLRDLLVAQFPEFEVETFDIGKDILRRFPGVVLLNLLHVFWLYGVEIVCRRRSVRDCFYRTPYIFLKIKVLIGRVLGLRRDEFAFSFQTQSLFDASLLRVPHFVYTDHTHLANLTYPSFERSRLFSSEWIELEYRVYDGAARVFVMSHHVARSLVEQYNGDPDRISCIGAGSNLRLTNRMLKNSDYQNQHIVFVGVDWKRKGGPLLVEAFKLVRKQLPLATLAIVGCSPKVDVPGVNVIGRVSLLAVADHLLQASVFCLPTRVEPFGIAAIEALTAKIPVVATRVGALPDIVQNGKSGILVDPDNLEQLANALIELLSDPVKCRRFGEVGQRSVEGGFSWEAVGIRLRNEILREIEGSQPMANAATPSVWINSCEPPCVPLHGPSAVDARL